MTDKSPQLSGAKEAEDKPLPSRWITATSDLTTTTKWLATTIGAVAAVALGTGPFLVAPKVDVFDGSWPVWRATIFIVSLLVAVLGVGIVIWQLLLLQSPKPVSLNAIPPEARSELDRDPGNYPPGTSDFAHFVTRLQDEKAALREARRRAAAETDEAEKRTWLSLAQARSKSLQELDASAIGLVDQAMFSMQRARLLEAKWPLIWGVVVLTLGLGAFQLIVSANPDGDTPTASSEQGTLIMLDSSASEALWGALDLKSCETETGRVPIILHGGNGSSDDPYEVETIAAKSGCRAINFNVLSDAGSVVTIVAEDEDEDE